MDTSAVYVHADNNAWPSTSWTSHPWRLQPRRSAKSTKLTSAVCPKLDTSRLYPQI